VVRSFWQGSEAKTDFLPSFRAAVDWYRSSGISDIIRDAITNDFAGATQISDGDEEKLLKIIKDVRTRTRSLFVIYCDLFTGGYRFPKGTHGGVKLSRWFFVRIRKLLPHIKKNVLQLHICFLNGSFASVTVMHTMGESIARWIKCSNNILSIRSLVSQRSALYICDTVTLMSNDDDDESIDNPNCTICLQRIIDRTVIPICSHEFCFECIRLWSDQSRRCPLCSQALGGYLIHRIRSKYDYQKHYLLPLPLRTSPPPPPPSRVRRQGGGKGKGWGRRDGDTESDRLDLAITKRRWIYRHHLYAKVRPSPYSNILYANAQGST
jgi:Ring finger domain